MRADTLRFLLFSISDRLAELSTSRWISHKGDQIDVYVLHANGVTPKIGFTETARKSHFASDLLTVAQVAAKIAEGVPPQTVRDVPPRSRLAVTERTWVLGKELATLKVTVTTPAPRKTPPGPTDGDESIMDEAPPGEAGPEKLEMNIVTGAKEHFFLSANAGASDAKQITYNESTKSLGPAKKPTGFYIATNYSFGDLYEDGQEKNFANRFILGMYVGAFVQASKRPFEQFGGLLGFRRNLVPTLDELISLQTVSPFIGINWVRNDHIAGSAAAPTIRSRYGKGHFIWGFSLNLDKALGWLSSGNAKTPSP